jgi:hypothetical protein
VIDNGNHPLLKETLLTDENSSSVSHMNGLLVLFLSTLRIYFFLHCVALKSLRFKYYIKQWFKVYIGLDYHSNLTSSHCNTNSVSFKFETAFNEPVSNYATFTFGTKGL